MTTPASQRHRTWRQKNREHVNRVARDRYAKNRDQLLARARKRREKNAETIRETSRRWRRNHPNAYRRDYLKDPVRVLWRVARRRAKARGLAFTITFADIVIPTVCPVFGTAMTLGQGREFRDTAPTVDRVDNTRGYEPGNVAVISWRANRIKSDSSLAELKRLVMFLEQHAMRRLDK